MEITKFFANARATLDAHHDRRERVIKLSRDITAQSKKLVFALHRVSQKNGKFNEARTKQNEIMALFKQLAPELTGVNYYRYARSFSGGLEEFIEAMAFFCYLENKRLISKEEIDSLFRDEDGNQWLYIQPEDYVLGLADFTGEMMRYAINTVTTGNYDKAMEICHFLRELSTDFEMLAASSLPILNKKMSTFRSSLAKVERACYAFQIRGSEYPKEMYQTIIRDHQSRYEEERGIQNDDD
ncbi:hypothetical protein VTP01DRAFT_8525 [Rhizomucor pusillus]|uniref:uncharacterized protein n=1 Tax=Rhizomucor pusillus TaxID=4840 RepID=UPI0037433044